MPTPDDLCRVLQSLYGLKNPLIVKQVESGYKAVSFVIQDGDTKFFLKKYHPKRSAERLLEVHKVKKFFKKQGFSTIPPLLNSEGSTLSRVNGELFAVFPYIEDKQYFGLPNEKAVVSAAKNLARLHLAGVGQLSLISKHLEPWDKREFLQVARRMLKLADAGATIFDRLASIMLTLKIDLAEKSSLSYEELGLKSDVILHGDYHIQNLFFDDQDNVSFTFDFERTMVGPRTTDIANGLFMICFDFNSASKDNISEIHFERAHSFIRAYNDVFPIEQEELAKGIRWFFWSQIVYIKWPLDAHYLENNRRSDKFLEKRLNRLEYLSKNFDATLDRLLCSLRV